MQSPANDEKDNTWKDPIAFKVELILYTISKGSVTTGRQVLEKTRRQSKNNTQSLGLL